MEINNMLYMAYDGDNAGRQVGRAILADDPDALHEVSARINLGHEIVSRWVQGHGGQVISGGGDEGTFSIPSEAMADIETLRGDYQFATNLTMTIGAGASLSQAGKSLLIGKFRGKNTVVQYDPSLEEEIRQVSERVGQGTASPEEQKLGEAYLKPEMDKAMEHNHDNGEDNCPYCQEMDGNSEATGLDDCPYCKDAETGAGDNCPYCQEMDGAAATDDCPYCKDADHEDDCPYCKDMDAGAAPAGENEVEPTAGPNVNEATAQSGEDYAAKDLNPPAIEKPQVGDDPQGLASPAIAEIDNQQNTNSNVALDVKNGVPVEAAPGIPPTEELGETPAAILAQLDADGSQATPEDVAAVANIDDAAAQPVGDHTENGTSRPEDFDRDVPGDMGLAEEEQSPDLSGVLREGLDNHAENAQREKVVQMVSEALEGFKGCKQVLEKAKEQAPQLYQSSLAMLRAMIEMAKMLGLNETTEETAEEVVGGQPGQEGAVEAAPGQEETHDWEEPFAEHPEHGNAAAQGDAAPGSPKPPRQ